MVSNQEERLKVQSTLSDFKIIILDIIHGHLFSDTFKQVLFGEFDKCLLRNLARLNVSEPVADNKTNQLNNTKCYVIYLYFLCKKC